MPPDTDFERYEREYLERIGNTNSENDEAKQARLKREYMVKRYSESALDSWDYVVLEMMRRDDMTIPLKLGTMRTAKALLRLHCHGMIHTLDREPTFDEMERLQAFFDSDIFKRYTSNLGKIMTKQAKEFFEMVTEITGARDMTDLYDLTEKGTKALMDKRAKTLEVYQQIDKQYKTETMTNFSQTSKEYNSYLPMMICMGISGPMIGYMLASSDAQYSMQHALANHMAGHHGGVQEIDLGGGDYFEYGELPFG